MASSITQATAKGTRSYQEDRLIVTTHKDGDLLAVFDGHGGDWCSEYLAEHFAGKFISCYEYVNDALFGDADPDLKPLVRDRKIISTTFRRVFKQLAEETKDMVDGSTASAVWIPRDTKVAHVAILGDSPVVIGRKKGYHLSPEHNARTNQKEREKAEKRGAWYRNGYLMATFSGMGLQMSRAFGDKELNKFLNRVPELYSLPLSDFVLVATDGAFDPGHTDAVKMIEADVALIRSDPQTTAQDIVNVALAANTGDNVSAILWRP